MHYAYAGTNSHVCVCVCVCVCACVRIITLSVSGIQIYIPPHHLNLLLISFASTWMQCLCVLAFSHITSCGNLLALHLSTGLRVEPNVMNGQRPQNHIMILKDIDSVFL